MFYHPDAKDYYIPEKFLTLKEKWHIPTQDKISLDAVKFSPETETKGSILFFHGNAQNLTAHFSFVAWLISYGYQIYIFDYRGYGKSSGKPERKGMVDDSMAAITSFCQKESKKPSFIFAQSLGGAIAIPALALMENHCIKAVVVESTFSSYRCVARKKMADFFLTWPFQYPLSYLVTDDYSPRDYINKFNLPFLFIHGESDRVVPYSEGLDLYQVYQGEEKKFWSVPGGHTSAFVDHKAVKRQELVKFLQSY